MATEGSVLYYGDNLEILRRHVADESVDLIYLDPPFNSNRSYNVLFKAKSGEDAQAQIEAFDDTWTWSQQSDAEYEHLVRGGAPLKVADAIEAMRKLLGENDLLAYLVMMTARLIELHRVLKRTGSIYLHCDPTASHYLKVVLDAVFGPTNFRSEVIWKRTGAHNSAKRWGPVHDVVLMFSKSDRYTWNALYQTYSAEYDEKFAQIDERGRYMAITLTGPGTRTGDSGQPWRGVDPTLVGRHWQPSSSAYDAYERLTGKSLSQVPTMTERLDAMDAAGLVWWPKKVGGVPRFKQYRHVMPGVPIQDVILDLPPLQANSVERLGYPTQKPVALLDRIVTASSNEGDVVLDPFCGCGTTVDAAQKLGRRWIGIDISYLSVALVQNRLDDTYGPEVRRSYRVVGIPHDLAGAEALFKANAFDFERWAVTVIGGRANEKQVGDRGIDGVIRFPIDKRTIGRVLVSVKGGATLNPAMVRDLRGTVEREKAEMGVLITLAQPTRGMVEEANRSGSYVYELTGAEFPRIQIATVPDLLTGKRPAGPAYFPPYTQAKRMVQDNQMVMFDIE